MAGAARSPRLRVSQGLSGETNYLCRAIGWCHWVPRCGGTHSLAKAGIAFPTHTYPLQPTKSTASKQATSGVAPRGHAVAHDVQRSAGGAARGVLAYLARPQAVGRLQAGPAAAGPPVAETIYQTTIVAT